MAGSDSLEYQSEKESPTRLNPELQQLGLFQMSPLVARRSKMPSEEGLQWSCGEETGLVLQ